MIIYRKVRGKTIRIDTEKSKHLNDLGITIGTKTDIYEPKRNKTIKELQEVHRQASKNYLIKSRIRPRK